MIDEIYTELVNRYYSYYCSVYYEFIIEAIKNTLKDLRDYSKLDNNVTIEMIHNHIKENYI